MLQVGTNGLLTERGTLNPASGKGDIMAYKTQYVKHDRKVSLHILENGKFAVTVDSLPKHYIDHKGSHKEYSSIEEASRAFDRECYYYNNL